MKAKAWAYGAVFVRLFLSVYPFIHVRDNKSQPTQFKRTDLNPSRFNSKQSNRILSDFILNIGRNLESKFLLLSSSSINDEGDSSLNWSGMDNVQILKNMGFGSRVFIIHSAELPVVAEYYAQGRWGLCLITGFQADVHTKTKKLSTPPLVEILIVNTTHADGMENPERAIVDIGQITTVWDPETISQSFSSAKSYLDYLRQMHSTAISSLEKNFPVHHIEFCMDAVHKSRLKARAKPLSKKTLVSHIDPKHPAQEIIRSVLKTGSSMTRLVESRDVIDYLYHLIPSYIDKNLDIRRIVSAEVVFRDFSLGGRFKRFPSIFLHRYDQVTEHPLSSPAEATNNYSVAIFNGGWLVLDSSSRATLEGLKFADRIHSANLSQSPCLTAADERIVHRLETLAMGDAIDFSSGDATASQLEMDVRQTLSALNVPLSPAGARIALVKMGKWSETDASNPSRERKASNMTYLNPWSKETLLSAKNLSSFMKKKREELTMECNMMCYKGIKTHFDGRVDLTLLPAVCIDAQRTTFRDDCISLRPRSTTGRKVLNNARWEILVHIADVSDIYCPNATAAGAFSVLLKAAESRGVSRYDLPVGPLHLMPPQALEALSFSCTKTNEAQSTNICVTVWVYLDEESGRLLDSGIERSVIAAPIAFTYDSANELLMNHHENYNSSLVDRSKQLLTIVERILSKWNLNQIENNAFAKKRDERLNSRQLVAESIFEKNDMADDGSKGSFKRSRSHRIVDMALDLYSWVLTGHLTRARVPFPRLAGNSVDRRGRTGTAPLRRYVDGLVQRQALSSLCSYGGTVMTIEECTIVAKTATDTVNKVRNINFRKGSDGNGRIMIQSDDKDNAALKKLQQHLMSHGSKVAAVPAIGTGHDNIVIIQGLGIRVKCHGVNGTLHPGERILVEIVKLNAENGLFTVRRHG